MRVVLPGNATVPRERVAPGVQLWDVSALLPKGRHQRQTHRPAGAKIEVVLVHHSGALGLPGFEGLLRSVRFATQQRDFPGPPYPYWCPFERPEDEEGNLVIFKTVPDTFRAWHSGARANDIGVAIGLQGNSSRLPISPSQVESLQALLPYLAERHQWAWEGIRKWLGRHSHAARWGGRAKPTCPGSSAERWLDEYLTRAA